MLYLLLIEKEKKKKQTNKREKQPSGIFFLSRADTPYWLHSAGIFPADRYN
jgi:hypothetical protein